MNGKKPNEIKPLPTYLPIYLRIYTDIDTFPGNRVRTLSDVRGYVIFIFSKTRRLFKMDYRSRTVRDSSRPCGDGNMDRRRWNARVNYHYVSGKNAAE